MRASATIGGMDEDSPGSAARQVTLVAVVFVAALVLMAGIGALAGQGAPVASGSPGSSGLAAAASPSTSATAAVSASPSEPVASESGPVASASGPAASASSPGSPSGAASPSGSAPSPSTGPLPGPSEDVVLVGAGDIADCSLRDDSATAQLVERLPGYVFTAGDDAYPSGTAQQFQDCYAPTWGRFLDRTILPAPGNHDWETDKAAGYLGYFGARANPKGTTWYSMDLGAWHVIVLDSECAKVGGCGTDSPQVRWLRDDLAASNARCTLAIWHKPRWSSGEHGEDRAMGPFWDALYAAGADVVVNGHDHDYERFAPQRPSGALDRDRGIREFVVGTGGAELRPLAGHAANSEVAVGKIAGVIQLTLQPGGYAWTFHSVTGEVSDQGSGRCH